MTVDKNFSSILELADVFPDELACIKHLEQMRWNGSPECPYCHHNKIYKFKSGKRYKCARCRRLFSVRVGTIFEDSNVPLRKWFMALYLDTAHKKGISSYQLAKDIRVSQKTSWFMLHRIRSIFKQGGLTEKLSGTVSADETYIGGKNENRHKHKKVPKNQGRSLKDKTPVIGLHEQGGKVVAKAVKDSKSVTLRDFIDRNVKVNSTLVTDELPAYVGLTRYRHEQIQHRLKEFVRDGYHTNDMEGFWALLKRGIYGIYHYVSPKHLQRYCEEFVFRYNTRHISDTNRFNLALNECEEALPYKKLMKKERG